MRTPPVGHQVVDLARSDTSAAALASAGAGVHRGTLDDLDSLRSGAAASDGVIHTAYIHDFTDFTVAAETDRRAVETLCAALAGSGRLFVMASGTAGLAPGRLATEEDAPPTAVARGLTEEVLLDFAVPLMSRGIISGIGSLRMTRYHHRAKGSFSSQELPIFKRDLKWHSELVSNYVPLSL